MTEKWIGEKYWVSEYNFHKEVTDTLKLPPKIEFHDATMRDGEQTPGVVFRKEEKMRIAQLLSDLGVHRIEAGMPAVSQEDAEAIKAITKMNLKSKIFVFSRAMRDDIDRAVDCGVDGVILEAPSGYPKLKHQFSWTEKELTEKIIDTINYAKKNGLFVNFFPFDTTRAQLPFLKRLLKNVTENSCPDSITVVDTTGSITPTAMRYLIRQVKEVVNLPLEVHTHNDFGMGTATTLAAVEEGVQVVHGCINGLGERTGNASLEEIALNLKTLYGLDIDIKLEKLYEVSQEIERMSGKKLAENKPVVGSLPFTREIGLGMKVLKESPLAIFPFLPELVGQELKIVMGKKSGKESVAMKLAEAGLEATEEQIKEIVAATKQKGIEKKGLVTPEEFLELAKEILNK
ncbi:MAG: 3-hydroxy-3-methylglutaryl-CoA lyase [Clostridia bacterium]|nr:3-hydroxy-3-methylglutaryl-CoA lyase [Clostridia bacterium]